MTIKERTQGLVGGQLIPSIGVLAAAGAWGLFWLPLRSLDANGIEGAWATFGLFAIGALALAPVVLVRAAMGRIHGAAFLVTGLYSGGAWILYTNSLLLTEVIRSLLLFYLTPLWSTLIVWLVHREKAGPARLAAVLMAIGGLVTILGLEHGLPLPRNAGDWMGLLSGMIWAYASVRIRNEPGTGAIEGVFAFFLLGAALAGVTVLLPFEMLGATPSWASVTSQGPVMIALSLGFIVPSMLMIVGGARRISPVRVGILLMAEAVVGTISAALLTSEPFGPQQIIGATLIIGAGLLDTLAAGERPGPTAARASAS